MKKYFKRTLLICTILAAGTAMADDLQDAKALLSSGKAAEAYQKLITGVASHQSDADYLYVAATAAIDAQNYQAAIPLLKQVIQLNNANDGARLDLGRAYYHTGQHDKARALLLTLKEKSPPAGASRVISDYLAYMDEYDRTMSAKTHWSVEGGGGYDDNINGATGQQQISIPLLGNALMNMSPGSLKMGASFVSLGVTSDVVKPLSEKLALFNGVSVMAKKDINHSSFNSITPEVRGGVMYSSGRNFAKIGLLLNQYYQGGSRSREGGGATADWYWVVNDANRVGVFTQYTNMRFFDTAVVPVPSMPNEDFNQTLIGTSWSKKLSDEKQVSLALMSIKEAAMNRVDGGKSAWAIRLTSDRSVGDNVKVSVGVGYQKSAYEKRNALFITDRKDRQYDVNAGISYQLSRYLSIRGQYTYLSVLSNIVIDTMNRNMLSVTLKRDY